MDGTQFNVLLVGENPSGWIRLQKHLEKRGCRCWLARSAKEALAPHAPRVYDLILSSVPVAQVDSFLRELGSAHPNVFYCHPVEDGCWWLPVVRHGYNCFGAPARGAEFPEILDQIIRDRQSQSASPGDPRTAVGSAAYR